MPSPIKILTLEDFPADAKLIDLELREAGLDFINKRVETKVEFLSILDSFLPDIIIVDYKMPQWTALDALKIIQEKNYNIPFILVTGNQAEKIAVESMRQGAVDYITKDSIKRLPNALVNALKNKKFDKTKFDAEEALRTEYNFRKTIEETMIAGISVVDVNLIQNYVNAAFCQMVGWSEQELIGVKPPFVYWPEEKKEKLFNYMYALLDKKISSFQFETEYINKNGNPIDVQILSSAMKDHGNITGWVMVVHDITEQKIKERQIKASLNEKEILLKEIHHRVKNNMQIVSSLLSLQAGCLTDDKLQEVFNESRNRIKALALIHEYLYKSKELTKINFSNYINDLLNNIFLTYRINLSNYKFILSIDDIDFDIDTSINLGIIINELVSNSVKHALKLKKTSEYIIKILLKKGNNNIVLNISDNDTGPYNNANFDNLDSLGLQLVQTLVTQLEGSFDIKQNNGLDIRIKFNYHTVNNV